MSERFMTQAQYNDSESVTYPVRGAWVRPLTPYDNIAAELDAAMTLFQRVEYDEGARMGGESLSRQAHGIKLLWELRRALTT